MPPPPHGFKEYKKNLNAGGVREMIARIITDAKALEADTVLDEEEVTKAHKDFVKEMNASIDAVSKSIVMKTEEKVRAKDDNVVIEKTLTTVELESSSRKPSRTTTPG